MIALGETFWNETNTVLAGVAPVANGGLSGNIPNGTTDYLYTGMQCVEERDDQDDPQTQYVWGHYIDELVFMITDVSGTPAGRYPLCDMRYSAIALADPSGNIVETYDTDPYGNTLIFDQAGTPGTGPNASGWWSDDAQQAEVPVNPYLYTGRRHDAETELYFFRARTYHPTLGRFIQRDPIGYQDGMNLYAGYFAMWMGVDPMGLDSRMDCHNDCVRQAVDDYLNRLSEIINFEHQQSMIDIDMQSNLRWKQAEIFAYETAIREMAIFGGTLGAGSLAALRHAKKIRDLRNILRGSVASSGERAGGFIVAGDYLQTSMALSAASRTQANWALWGGLVVTCPP